jgi:acyl dehydratase
MNPADLEGKTYGPVPWSISANSVSDFIHLTGDDPARWSHVAPPGYAAAALFAVAPDLLAELYDSSVIHGEQAFSWHGPLSIGGFLDVKGEVTRVRERGGVNFITFDVQVRDEDSLVLTGKSLFLVSGMALPGGEPGLGRAEPPHSFRGDPGPSQLAASRADLVRYASATRDWNPVHWDHEAGVSAGFSGIVVHGLLQAGWALRIAGAETRTVRPFSSAKFRFRNPLHPARPVDHEIRDGDGSLEVILHDEDHEYLTASIVVADE